MRLFILLLCLGIGLSTPVLADNKSEAAVASVRLFHEICMGSVTNPDKVAQLLSKFQKLPEEKAVKFRESLDSSPESQVWSFNFPKANFVAVINPQSDKCELISDKQLRFDDVNEEFSAAAQGFSSIEGFELSEIKVDRSSLMTSLRYEYSVPAKDIIFEIFASVKNNTVKQGQMGSIYTMTVRKISP